MRTALDYVRGHLTALGLTAADLDTLRLDSARTTGDGVTHVRWVPGRRRRAGVRQRAHRRSRPRRADPGRRRFARAPARPEHRDAGSDRAGGAAGPDGPRRLQRRADRRGRRAGAAPADGFSDGSTAELVQFDVNGVLRLAWRIRHRASSTDDADAVIDAVSGRLLHRANFVKFAVNANVFPHYPGAARRRRAGHPRPREQAVLRGDDALGPLRPGLQRRQRQRRAGRQRRGGRPGDGRGA